MLWSLVHPDLQAVVDSDQSVVAGIGLQIILLHHIHSGGGYRSAIAEAWLAEEAQVRARRLTAGAGLDAATEVEVACLKIEPS